MYIPKKYGQYKEEKCPFCSNRAIAKNKQGLNVCNDHKTKSLEDIKCLCGSYLDIRIGKFGPYFNCVNCGNMNLKKGLEMQSYKSNKQQKASVNKQEKKDDFIIDTGKYDNFDYGVQ